MDLGSKDILSLIHDLNGKNVGERNKADKDIWECQQKIGFYKDIVSKILGNKNSDSELLQMFVQMVTRRWLQELDGLKTKEFFEEVKKPFIDLLLNINSPSSEKQLLEIVKKVAERSEARDEWLVDFLLKSGSILAIQALVVYFKSFDGIDDSIEMKNSNESITIFLQKSLEKSYKTDALMTTALIQLIDCLLSHVWDMASEKSTSSLLVFEACMCILELETDAPEWLECQKSAMKLVENVCSYTVIEEGNIFARLFVNIKKRLENMTKEHCDDEMYEIMRKIVRLYSDVHKFEPGQKPSYLLSDIIISKALEVNIDEEATMCMTEPQSYAKSLIEDYFEINYRTSVRNVRLNSLCAFIREAVVYSSDYEHPSIQFFKEHQHWFTEGDLKEKHFIWSFIFSLLDDGDGVDYTHKNDFPFFDAQLKGFILRKSLHVLKQRLDKDYTQHPLIVCDVIKFLQWQRKQCSVDELKDLTDIMSSLLKVETHHAIEDMCLFFLHKTLFLQYDTSPVMPQDYLRQKLEELVDPSNHHHLKHTSLYLTVIKEVLATLNRGILPIPKVLYLFLKNCLRVIVDAPTDKKTDGRFVSLVFGCIQHLAWLAHFETYCSIEKNGFKSDNDLLDNFNDHFLEVFRDLVYHKQHQEYHLFILFLLVKTLSHSEKSLKNELTWVMVDVKEDSSYKMEKLTDAMKERSKNLNCIYLPIIAKFFPSNNFSTASLWWDKTHIDSLVFCAQVYIRKFPERMDRNALMQIALRLLDGPYDFCAKGLRIMLALVEVMDVALLKSEFPDILKVIVKALQYNQKRSFLLAICTFFGIIFLKLDAKFIVEACDSIKPRLFRDLCANVFLTSALKVGSYTDKNIFSHFIIGALEYFSDKVAEGKEVEKKENIDFCVRFIHLATVTKEEYTVQVHKPNYDGNSSFYDQMGVFSYLNEILFHEKPHFIQDSLKKLFDKHSFLIELEEYKTIKLEKNDKYDTVEKSKMKSFFERKKIASVPALSSYPDYEYYECE